MCRICGGGFKSGENNIFSNWVVLMLRNTKLFFLSLALAVPGSYASGGGLPELNEVVVNGSYRELVSKLDERIWTQDELGKALIASAGVNRPAEALLLLENGAEVDFAVLLRTSLIVAAYNNSIGTAEVLLEAGADPNYVSSFDWRPLHNSMRRGVSNDDMIRLLIENGADIDARTNLQITPLHRAAGFCLSSAVTVLLELGADRQLRDKYNQTAADRAEKAGCHEIAGILR